MDPKATWQRHLDALSDDDVDEALEALRDLNAWLEQGGFLSQEKGFPTPSAIANLLRWLECYEDASWSPS